MPKSCVAVGCSNHNMMGKPGFELPSVPKPSEKQEEMAKKKVLVLKVMKVKEAVSCRVGDDIQLDIPFQDISAESAQIPQFPESSQELLLSRYNPYVMKENDDATRYLTGLFWNVYRVLADSLVPHIKVPRKNLPPESDQILADRGFTLVDDFAVACSAELIIPQFTKGKKQLDARLPMSVEITRKIANVRIQVERVIGLLKNRYGILSQGPLPLNLVKSKKEEVSGGVPHIEKLVTVCSSLINLSPGIVYKET
eukprot:gene10026-18656_t